jgi:hypothetical protein
MTFNQQPAIFVQPALFELGDTSSGTLELMPKLWFAAEALSSPNETDRRAGLEVIIEKRAARLSPLLSYLVFTRITDPDLDLRKSVVEELAHVLGPDEQGLPAPQQVRVNLYTHLTKMDKNHISALLQVADYDPSAESQVEILIKVCTLSGNHLAEIVCDRSMPLKMRELAVVMIGRIGYLDAQSTLQRLANRLEAKVNGQQIMPFKSVNGYDEATLLPEIRTALELLSAP